MKYVIGLLLASLSMFTYAQRTPLACQVDRAAGLAWEQGKWIVSGFHSKKFILVKEDRSLTIDSIAKALEAPSELIKCDVNARYVTCFDGFGGSLLFSNTSNKGGISQLNGATSDSTSKKDTVAVEAFTCTPF